MGEHIADYYCLEAGEKEQTINLFEAKSFIPLAQVLEKDGGCQSLSILDWGEREG